MRTRSINRAAAAVRAVAQITLVSTPFLFAGGAHAASATGSFTVSMPVNSPTCTVATSNSTVALPTAGSANQTLGNYFSTNGLTTAAQEGGLWFTSATLNQTATITCSTASTPILSFTVEPAGGASLFAGYGAQMYMVDSATTPNKAGGGFLALGYEQVSVNGTAAPQPYETIGSGSISLYTTTFTTSAVPSGTATVVWRPALQNNSSTAAMGTPTGGSYNSPGQIVVNY
jgi:hypothetical protein